MLIPFQELRTSRCICGPRFDRLGNVRPERHSSTDCLPMPGMYGATSTVQTEDRVSDSVGTLHRTAQPGLEAPEASTSMATRLLVSPFTAPLSLSTLPTPVLTCTDTHSLDSSLSTLLTLTAAVTAPTSRSCRTPLLLLVERARLRQLRRLCLPVRSIVARVLLSLVMA
jgi:hypothetical protein